MTAHLLESTLLLGIAIAVAYLPRLAARTRYAVVFLALVKFAVPWKVPASSHGTIAITVPGPLAVTPHAVAAPSIWPAVLEAAWLAVAVALFVLIVWRSRRAVAEALDGAVPAPDREQALVPLRGVALLRSPGAMAPAAIGILRPRIVIPADLELDDDELEAILAHECAHVARRDNLLALVDAAFGAALWFHPLVWLARRILARAREEACDEIVVAGTRPETYLAALASVCRAAAAPRVAGVSCIAGNSIRERMNAIMTLPLRRSLPHRLIVAAAVIVLAGAALVHAADKAGHYAPNVAVKRDRGQFIFNITIVDRATGKPVSTARLTTPAGVDATLTTDGTPKFKIRARGENDGNATVVLEVYDAAGALLETSIAKTMANGDAPAAQGISISLKDADLRDVINTFGKLTGMATQIDDDVHGTISVEFHDVPWDQAFQHIVADNGCVYSIEGNTLHVRRAN